MSRRSTMRFLTATADKTVFLRRGQLFVVAHSITLLPLPTPF